MKIDAPKANPDGEHYDVVVIGGGLAGASLAVALKNTDKRILVVEPAPPHDKRHVSFDRRTVALTHGAGLIFDGMGIWNEIAGDKAEAIRDIHISNRGCFGKTHLSHKHAGTEALGYVVPARTIGGVLWKEMENAENIRVSCPSHAENIEQTGQAVMVELLTCGEKTVVSAKIAILADGGRSAIGEKLDLPLSVREYDQSAILSMVEVDRPHHGRAYERFTDEGPLALLPHPQKNSRGGDGCIYALVWTTGKENLTARMALDDGEFIAHLQKTFGDRAGSFSRPAKRKVYKLKRVKLSDPVVGRTVVIGNAAHTVHPVAGQGFNLGLRDVAALAEQIHDSGGESLGSPEMLERYKNSRAKDAVMVDIFTHSLIEIFTTPSLAAAGSIGLEVIEYLPMVKRMLLKRTMGLAGRPSRLAMGLPLSRRTGHFAKTSPT